jgi:hypothetical protein
MKTANVSNYITNMEGKPILTANQSHHGMGHRLEEKERLLSISILASKTAQAAIRSIKVIMLRTRITFKITYPGPARDSRKRVIMIEAQACFCTCQEW